jgi:hypothetical protein
MTTLGGARDVPESQNSLEIDGLARFAVEEHNKKQVSFFLSFPTNSYVFIVMSICLMSEYFFSHNSNLITVGEP